MTEHAARPEPRIIPLSQVVEVEGFDPRERSDEEADAQLADSIRRHGVIQPLVVCPAEHGGYELVAGHRRYRAAAAAAMTEVPVVVRARDADNALELAVVENLIREDLDPISEARGIERVMKSERHCYLRRAGRYPGTEGLSPDPSRARESRPVQRERSPPRRGGF